MPCISCGRDFHEECLDWNLEADTCCCDEIVILSKQPYRKDRATLRDPLSTGRKEAAKLFPLNSEADCEWRGLRYAGGGKHPIIGCTNGKQKHRHHGPDKETTNNETGNVHLICSFCHNRWHTNNDKDFDPSHSEFRMHDAETLATIEEQLENELHWSSIKFRPRQGSDSD